MLPIKRWRDGFIRRHLDKCPSCQQELISREDARELFHQSDNVDDLNSLIEKVEILLEKKNIAVQTKSPAFYFSWRWATVMITSLVAILLILWHLPGIQTNGRFSPALETKFRLIKLFVRGSPTGFFIYQPGDSNITLVGTVKSLEK